MFQLWRARSHSPELLEEAGKQPRGYTHTSSRACPWFELCAHIKEYVPSITHTQSTPNVAAYIKGKIGNHSVSLLLDSGASCSVVKKDYTSGNLVQPIEGTELVNADMRTTSPCGTLVMAVILGNLQVNHKFIVLDTLSTPVILGCDFLTKHNLIMDFSQQAVHQPNNPSFKLDMPLVRMSSCNALALDDELPQALPTTIKSTSTMPIEMPEDVHPDLVHLINNYKQLFSTQLRKTTTMEHVIDTGEAAPIKVPPCPIPFHYTERAHNQLQEMAKNGIIQPSNSPWCAPADKAYWVGMATDTISYCSFCSTCQISKSLPTQPAPLQPIIASRPWELVAVDILKVPQSAKGNQYILVAQDYFSKWPYAQSMPNQKAE